MEGGSLQELIDGVSKVLQQMELEEAISQDFEEGNTIALEAHA